MEVNMEVNMYKLLDLEKSLTEKRDELNKERLTQDSEELKQRELQCIAQLRLIKYIKSNFTDANYIMY